MSEDSDDSPYRPIPSPDIILWGMKGLFTIGEIVAIFLLFLIFAIGLINISKNLFDLIIHGEIGSTSAVISLIDSVLLLFIVVEAKETVVAYIEHESREEVVAVVIFTAIIAMVRRIITFHTGSGGTQQSVSVVGAYTVLVVGLGVTYYIIRRAPDVSG